MNAPSFSEEPPLRSRLARRDFLKRLLLSAGAVAFSRTSLAEEAPFRFDLLRRLWSVPLAVRIPGELKDSWRAIPPLVYGDHVVLVQDRDGIRALDLRTGKAAWPYGDEDAGFLLNSGFSLTSRTVPTTLVYPGTIQRSFWFGFVDHQLVAVDLAAEGRVVWLRSPSELAGSPHENCSFQGSSIPAADGILLLISDLTDSVSTLVLCDSRGVPRWRNHLPIGPKPNQNSHGSVAVSGETAFWNQGGSQLLAVSLNEGTTRWEVPFPPPGRDDRLEDDPMAMIHVDGPAVVASSGHRVVCIEVDSGELQWESRCSFSVEQIVRISEDRIVLAGAGLCCIDSKTGQIRWGQSTSGRGFGLGRLVRLGRCLICPAGEELWTVDAMTGQLLQRDDLRGMLGMRPEEIALAGEIMLIAGPDRLVAVRVAFSER